VTTKTADQIQDEQLDLLRKYLSQLRDPGRGELTLAVVVDLVLFSAKIQGKVRGFSFRDPRENKGPAAPE
jgi:hypothetical protein